MVGMESQVTIDDAYAMNKSITQATQNDKQISKSIKRFSCFQS